MAVKRTRLVVVLSAHLDAGHVTQAYNAGRRVLHGALARLHHNRLELLWLTQPAHGIDRQLKRLALGGRRLADLPGWCIEILCAYRFRHVHGRHVPRRQFLRIEPGTDAVVALAHVVDVRHAVDAEQLVLDVDRGEVAQVNVVVAAAGREKVDNHQDIRGFLPDRDPLVLNGRRQLRHGERNSVLHHDERRVYVRADIERDSQRV